MPDEDLPGANALRSVVGMGAVAAGPVVGAVVLLLGPPSTAFLLNAATFTLSALAVLSVPGCAAFAPPKVAGDRSVIGGAGAVLVEVLCETALQRDLDDEVFARAYGIALPLILAGIVGGSLVAAPLVALVGLPGAIVATGLLAAGVRRVRRPARPQRRTAPGSAGRGRAGTGRGLTPVDQTPSRVRSCRP